MWEIHQCTLFADLPLQVHTSSALQFADFLDCEQENGKTLSEMMSTVLALHGMAIFTLQC